MAEEKSVGSNIRRLRDERGYSLRSLADRCGLSVNAISRIERGANSPTVNSLEQIARALGVSVVSLFENESDRLVLFRSDQYAQAIERGGLLFESLVVESSEFPFQCVRITARPGHKIRLSEVAHPGYEFIYCLEGSIVFSIEENQYRLNCGDCICLDARQAHCWHNEWQSPATILVITYSADGLISYPLLHPEILESPLQEDLPTQG